MRRFLPNWDWIWQLIWEGVWTTLPARELNPHWICCYKILSRFTPTTFLFYFYSKTLIPTVTMPHCDYMVVVPVTILSLLSSPSCSDYWTLNTHRTHTPGGGTHIFDRTGMCRSNGSLFYKKSLNMGPVFYQKILKHGSTFLTEPKFSGIRVAKKPKIAKFLKNWPIFQEKSLKMGTLFCQNHP